MGTIDSELLVHELSRLTPLYYNHLCNHARVRAQLAPMTENRTTTCNSLGSYKKRSGLDQFVQKVELTL